MKSFRIWRVAASVAAAAPICLSIAALAGPASVEGNRPPAGQVASGTAAAEPNNPRSADVPEAIVASIKKTMESRFKGVHVLDVQPAALAGLYEVFLGDRIVYSDASGEYVMVGDLIETRTRANLTKVSLEKRDTLDFKSLPFDKAIKIVKGDGSRPLAVFEDPDCPFCQRLETQLKSVTNVTEYVFLFPLDELHPQASLHAHAIWCAPDRVKAWTDYLLDKKLPAAAKCQGDPISELSKLGEKLNVNGTPTSFTANGKRITGAVPAADIEKALVASTGPGAATPAATAR